MNAAKSFCRLWLLDIDIPPPAAEIRSKFVVALICSNLLFVRSADRSDFNPLRLARPTLVPWLSKPVDVFLCAASHF